MRDRTPTSTTGHHGTRIGTRAAAAAALLVGLAIAAAPAATATPLTQAAPPGCMIDQLRPGAQCAMSDLAGALASGRDMNNINLLGSHLAHSFFVRANLMGADLRRVELHNAMLSHADLRGARMIGAELDYANLEGANLLGASIAGATFTGTELTGATWIDGRRCAEHSTGTCR